MNGSPSLARARLEIQRAGTSQAAARHARQGHGRGAMEPGQYIVESFERLQQTAGNRAVHESLASPPLPGGGTPLPSALREDMERRFGHDFSAVQLHTGAQAARSAEDLHAKAYTVGTHIVFSEGRFAPGTLEGKRLLVHELAHVVQQSRGGALPRLDPQAPFERSAHAAAVVLSVGGGPVTVAGATGVGVARAKEDEEQHIRVVADVAEGKVRVIRVDEKGHIIAGLAEITPPRGAALDANRVAVKARPASNGGALRYRVTIPEDWHAEPAAPNVEIRRSSARIDPNALQGGIRATHGEGGLPKARSLGPQHHTHKGPYRIVPYVRDPKDPKVVYYTAFNTKTGRIEYAIPPGELAAFLANIDTHAARDHDRAMAEAKRESATAVRSFATQLRRRAGEESLPVDPESYQGGIALEQVVRSDLPPATSSNITHKITAGAYLIIPKVRREDGEERLLYYTAYNASARRVEYVIPPGQLDDFVSNTATFQTKASLAIDAPGVGVPGVQELTPEHLAYHRYLYKLIAKSDLPGALGEVGEAWKAKWEEWKENPLSFLLYMSQFLPSGGAKPRVSPKSARPPSVAARRTPTQRPKTRATPPAAKAKPTRRREPTGAPAQPGVPYAKAQRGPISEGRTSATRGRTAAPTAKAPSAGPAKPARVTSPRGRDHTPPKKARQPTATPPLRRAPSTTVPAPTPTAGRRTQQARPREQSVAEEQTVDLMELAESPETKRRVQEYVQERDVERILERVGPGEPAPGVPIYEEFMQEALGKEVRAGAATSAVKSASPKKTAPATKPTPAKKSAPGSESAPSKKAAATDTGEPEKQVMSTAIEKPPAPKAHWEQGRQTRGLGVETAMGKLYRRMGPVRRMPKGFPGIDYVSGGKTTVIRDAQGRWAGEVIDEAMVISEKTLKLTDKSVQGAKGIERALKKHVNQLYRFEEATRVGITVRNPSARVLNVLVGPGKPTAEQMKGISEAIEHAKLNNIVINITEF